MHVAIEANCLAWGWGGIQRHVDRITRELASEGDLRIDLLANTRRPLEPIPGTRQVLVRRKSTLLWHHAFVVPWLLRHRPDVFWAPETAVPVWRPTPTVVTVHDLAPLLLPEIKPRREHAEMRLLWPRTTRSATRVIAVSASTAGDVGRLWGLHAPQVRVVPNGVDALFVPGDRAAAKTAVARRWNVEEPFVLALGSLEPRKGLDVLVEAAIEAERAGSRWRLVLAGQPGFGSEALVRAAEASPACRVIGRVGEQDLVDLYRAAAVLAAPSRYEGFGLSPLEAMACGTPAVVADDSGGLVEVSGAAAVVVAQRTPAAWRAGLEQAMARREELVERGLRHVEQYRWPRVARLTRAVLEEAAGAA